MSRIKTKQELIEYTKAMLGAPIIQIEVTDLQISHIIDAAVQKFTEYAYGTLEDAVIVELNGVGEYPVPDLITNIIKLSKGTGSLGSFTSNYGEGYVPDMWSEIHISSNVSTGGGGSTGSFFASIIPISGTRASYEKYFGTDVNCNFNPYRKTLQLLENFKGKALLHYQYEYIPKEEDFIYNHEWIKEYVKAKTKEMWGTVTGKFDQTLVGGARINYDRLLSEAQNEIEKLNQELLDKWSDPVPIMIG